jgi:hypothetical protein
MTGLIRVFLMITKNHIFSAIAISLVRAQISAYRTDHGKWYNEIWGRNTAYDLNPPVTQSYVDPSSRRHIGQI